MTQTSWRDFQSVDAVDTAYLTNLVRNAGFPGAEVRKFSSRHLTDNSFGGGGIHRFWLQYEPGTKPAGPSSMILKVAKPNPYSSNDHDYVCREAQCYRNGLFDDLSHRLHVPQPYHTVTYPEQDQCWIWMEDLGDEAFQVTWTEESLQKSTRDIAHLHAQWWGKTAALKQWPFLRYRAQAMYHHEFRTLGRQSLEEIDAHPAAGGLNTVFTPRRKALLLQLAKSEDFLYGKLDALPQTLLHQDFWPPNIALYQGKTALIDWSYTGIGTPGAELSIMGLACLVWLPAIGTRDAKILVEPLWEGLHKKCGLPIRYEEVLAGYELAFLLRPAAMLVGYILRSLLDGASSIPNDPNDFTDLDTWLELCEVTLRRIEQAAKGTGFA